MPKGRRYEPTRVLIVSTSDGVRERYAETFRAFGYCTLLAGTTADACRLATELQPAAVIADVGLSISSDGVPLVRQLRQDLRLRRVPVVILAGSRTAAETAAPATAGADIFVMPPGDARRLVEAVRSLIGSPFPEHRTAS